MEMALENASLMAEQRYRRSLKAQEMVGPGNGTAGGSGFEKSTRKMGTIDISHLGGQETVGSLVQTH